MARAQTRKFDWIRIDLHRTSSSFDCRLLNLCKHGCRVSNDLFSQNVKLNFSLNGKIPWK